MRCANCGAEVADGTVFCPSCGHRVRRAGPISPPQQQERPAPAYQPVRRAVPEEPTEEPASERVSGCRWLALTGLFTLLFLVIIAGLGALGVYHGLQDQTREKLQLSQEHYQKAEAYVAEGNLDLAIAELEEALRLNPGYAEAQAKLDELEAQEIVEATPTPNTTLEMADKLYGEARTLYDQHDWEQAISKLEELRAVDVTYQQKDVERLLFWSYYNSGLALVNEGRMQEAIHRFDLALGLQPDNPDALGQRHLATLYATGVGYWEADWPRAIAQLKDVYQIEPNYRDVRQRLHDAHVSYGDQLAAAGNWCQAEQEYAAALQVIATDEVAKREANAASQCAGSGGVIPVGPGTPAPSKTPAPKGTFVGELTEYQDVSVSTGEIRGRVLDKAGNPVAGQVVRIQAFDWTAFATADTTGVFGFGSLNQELTFTLSLVDLPSEPLEVPVKFHQRAMVLFQEQR